MPIHNDEPTLLDCLDRGELLNLVATDVATCCPPCVFGIHGEWGSGKTSFLHQLHLSLTGDCPQQTEDERKAAKKRVEASAHEVEAVWFEAWRYQHEKDPVVALLHEIRTQLPLYSKWLNEGKKLADVAIRGALMSIEDITARLFGFRASKIQEAGEKYERENLAVALPSHTIREHLNAALDQLLGRKTTGKRKNARLVILIDDLDRCEPAAAFRLLEGIKIYLNLPSCVFVLGMNLRIIERAIAKHTAQDDSPELRHEYAREYLDKLCNNIWHLPLIACLSDTLEKWLPDELPDRNDLLGVVREHACVAANPRKIKSFANVLSRFVDQMRSRQPAVITNETEVVARRAQLTVLLACLYHEHYELYRRIESEPEFYNLIRQWAGGMIQTDPEKQKPHELLYHLRLPVAFHKSDASERTSTPGGQPESTYVDPERGNVFRLQSLVRTLGEVTTSELKPYLLSGTVGEQETQD